ncbi:MAG: universal stress protein [Rivularia sp. ALOHA_DT_140]|nr:universal stress protein [Rivularia sp. ALOHA_DT_140]
MVSIDNSDISQQILDEAVLLAKQTDGNLMLLHVLSHSDEEYVDSLFIQPPILEPELLIETQEKNLSDWEQLKQDRAKWMRSLCELATSFGIQTKFTMGTGNPSRIICDVASNWNAELIVIGRRGMSGINELFLGSVSNYVVHHALCSVLTIQ